VVFVFFLHPAASLRPARSRGESIEKVTRDLKSAVSIDDELDRALSRRGRRRLAAGEERNEDTTTTDTKGSTPTSPLETGCTGRHPLELCIVRRQAGLLRRFIGGCRRRLGNNDPNAPLRSRLRQGRRRRGRRTHYRAKSGFRSFRNMIGSRFEPHVCCQQRKCLSGSAPGPSIR